MAESAEKELRWKSYSLQVEEDWETEGRSLYAQFDDDSVVLYQAFSEEIASFAVEHQHFGGPHYSTTRTTWVKPNFTWMVSRAGWGTKTNQERILAIWVRRDWFDKTLLNTVYGSFPSSGYEDKQEWRTALNSAIVLQWDPDHEPFSNTKMSRRCIQLGLRGFMALEAFCNEDETSAILQIRDITDEVAEQRERGIEELMTPLETVYPATQEILDRVRITGVGH